MNATNKSISFVEAEYRTRRAYIVGCCQVGRSRLGAGRRYQQGLRSGGGGGVQTISTTWNVIKELRWDRTRFAYTAWDPLATYSSVLLPATATQILFGPEVARGAAAMVVARAVRREEMTKEECIGRKVKK